MSKLLHSFNVHVTRQPGPLKQSPTMETVALRAPALLNSREFTTLSTQKTQILRKCRYPDPAIHGITV